MAKPMKARDFAKALASAGCSSRSGKGSHVVWDCPTVCGQHKITVTSGHGTVAPNAMRDVKHKLLCVSIPGMS